MKHYDVLVIGAGAAGMVSAVAAARVGARVAVLEKMSKPGRKIMITGKGRCNFTNMKPWSDFSAHIHPDRRFFKHAFHYFTNKDTVDFFNTLGVDSSVERGERVFPASGKAASIVDALKKEMDRLGVSQFYNTPVTSIIVEDNAIKKVCSNSLSFTADSVIIATGGLSYPSTGSQGDGHILAKNAGHTVAECMPSLTALMPSNYNLDMKGLLLKNIELSLVVGNDLVQTERGEIEFTNNGIEGALGYRLSRRAVKAIINGNKCSLILNLKPALDYNTLLNRVLKELPYDINANQNTYIFLRSYMPSVLAHVFISRFSLPHKISDIQNKQLFAENITHNMQHWAFDITAFTSYDRAVVTAGGVPLNEINPKSMQSKKTVNLFFAGEVMDLDGDTGGYNLQIAFSTGYKAGEEAAYLTLKSK